MSGITLLDLAKRKLQDSEVGLIDEAARPTPEISGINPLTGARIDRLGSAKKIRATNYKTRVRTALPQVGFRDINEGTTSTKSTTENRLVSCHLMNPRWDVDKGAEGFDSEVREEMAEEAQAHIGGAFQQAGKCHFYGKNTTYGGHAKGFPGLLDSVTDAFLVDATGTAANAATSVYAVCYGTQGVRWVLGNDGQFELTDPRKESKNDSNGNPYTVLLQELFAHIGLQVGSTQCVGRIKNLTAQAGKGLTTGLLRDLLRPFANVGKRPDAILMTQQSYDQYEAHLESLAVSPPEAGRLGFRNIPFVVTPSLSDMEEIDLAASATE